MWMILALFGSLAAGAAADAMLSMRGTANQDDDPDTDNAEQDEIAGGSDVVGGSDGNLLSYVGNDPAPIPSSADAVADHDLLPERIHSSDAYDPPPADQPVIASGSDVPSSLNGAALGDWLTGGSAQTYLVGHGGDDVLRATAGATEQIGGEGDDALIGGPGDDRMDGCEGDDLLIAGGGSNTMMGGAGNDILVGAHLNAGPDAADTQNFLNGGAGDDVLVAGSSDYMNGGSGADTFALGDWLQGHSPVTVVDYEPGEDQILLHYNPAQVPNPDLEIRFGEDTPQDAQIWLNGQIVAQVMQAPGLTVADVGLVPYSTGAIGGLAA